MKTLLMLLSAVLLVGCSNVSKTKRVNTYGDEVGASNAKHGLRLPTNTGASSWNKTPGVTVAELRQRFLLAGEAIHPGMSPEQVQTVLGIVPLIDGHAHIYSTGSFSRTYIIRFHPVYGAMHLTQRESRLYKPYTKFNCSTRPPRAGNVPEITVCFNNY